MKKYNVGIVGLWYGLNYGSILTYYALYNVIDSMGYKAIMVNKPNELWTSRYIDRNTIANKFIYNNCNVSEIKQTYQQWHELNDECDTFVVGSDVVWNYEICGRESGQFFFLDFADDDKKKIAMASSFGAGYNAPEKDRIIAASYMKKFDFIGVREKEGVDICMEKFGVKADMVMDPVFLCNKSVYDSFANSSKVDEKEKFIATYILGPSLNKKKIIVSALNRLGLAIRALPNPNSPQRFKEVTGIPTVGGSITPSVEDWLYYIKNSELFIGDSFHGLCFSLIFNKPFVVVIDSKIAGLCRFTSLLEMLGLEDRIFYVDKPNKKTVDEIIDTPIDFDKVNKILAENSEASYRWLKNAISCGKASAPKNAMLVEKYSNTVEDKNIMCSGCGACASVCPKDAIKMEENTEGFFEPVIDKNICVECGLCIKKCTDLNPQYKNVISPKCYAVMANDDVRNVSSSGGMFTLAAEYVLGKGGYVCGAVYKEDFSVEHIIVNNIEELEKLRGSKYMQSNTDGVFRKIKALLNDDKYVLFTGMPCQTAGLYSYLGKDYEKLYTVELLCHGITSHKVFEKFHKDVLGNEKLSRLEFKEKKPWGWCAGINAYFADGSKYSVRSDKDPFFRAYLNSVSKNRTCPECKYNRLPRQADLTIGDFWGINKYDVDLNDGKGTSVVLVNSRKGREFFDQLVPKMKKCKEETLDSAIKGNPVIVRPYKLHKNRETFFKCLDSIDFSELTEKCISDNINNVNYINEKTAIKEIPRNLRYLYYIAKIAVEKSKGRKIVTWTHSPYFEDLLKTYFEKNVTFSIAKNPGIINNTTVFPISSLDGGKDKYYVVALHPNCIPAEIAELTNRGYTEADDFIFAKHKPITVLNHDLSKGRYEDEYGNTIDGEGIIGKVIFKGNNNHLFFGRNIKNSGKISIRITDNADITFGNNISIDSSLDIQMLDTGSFDLTVKDACHFLSAKFQMWGSTKKCSILIGEHCTFGIDAKLSVASGKKISIGRDCMFSHDIILRSGDGHSMFDVNTCKNINSDLISLPEWRNSLVLGNHIWVGERAIIMHGACIGNGSIVGSGSFVKSEFPNNCAIGGNPAKIIRRDVAWSRKNNSNDIRDCGTEFVNRTAEIVNEGQESNTALVFGGTKFAGVRLVEKLLERGYKVTIATRGKHTDNFGQKVERVVFDRNDEFAIIKLLSDKYFDYIFDFSVYTAEHIRYTLAHTHCKHYILVSSAAAYDAEGNISFRSENMADPDTVHSVSVGSEGYSAVKLNSEIILRQEYRNVKSSIVRAPAVIDEDNLSEGDISTRLLFYVEHILKEIPFNERNIQRPCAFVRTTDEADFMIYLAEHDVDGCFNIASDGNITLNDIICYIEKKTGKKAVITENGEANPFPFGGYLLNLKKAKSIGYIPANINDWIYNLLDKYIAQVKNEIGIK